MNNCRDCNKLIPASGEPGYQSRLCNTCRHIAWKLRAASNPELAEKKRLSQAKIPVERKAAYRRASKLKKQYGITQTQYDKMYSQQNGLCAICQKPESRLDPSRNTTKLCVDHNHETGKVRALLCHKCNIMIAYAGENTNTLVRSVEYLNKFNEM